MIKGLVRGLNEAGKIKIGKKGKMITSAKGNEFRPPEKLDHFIITTTEKDSNGDLVLDTELMDAIKTSDSGITNEKNDLIGIPIRLLYDDTELNFPTRMARYDRGRLVCEGDGETARNRLNNFDPAKAITCPCDHAQPDNEGITRCKPNGALTCVIDEAELFGQAHKFRTTSVNSIRGIISGIELIKTATGGKIAGLPLVLALNNKSVTTPTGQNTTVQVVSVCYRGGMGDLQRKCLQIAQEKQQFLVGMAELETQAKQAGAGAVIHPDDEDEDRDFQAEFYPDTIDIEQAEPTEEQAEQVEEQAEQVEEQAEQAKPGRPSPEISNRPLPKPTNNNSQLVLLDRLVKEPDKEKAIKLAKRLDKYYLVMLLEKFSNVKFEEFYTKPALVDIAITAIETSRWPLTQGGDQHDDVEIQADTVHTPETSQQTPTSADFNLDAFREIPKQIDMVNSLRQAFPDHVINPTLPQDELIALAESLTDTPARIQANEPAELTTESLEDDFGTPPVDNGYRWDDGPKVARPVLIQFAKIKQKNNIDDADWKSHLAKYVGIDGKPLRSAIDMTAKQATHFLTGLEIPF